MTATNTDWVQRGTVRAELEAAESAGRGQAEPEDPVRTCWMRDLDRIIFSRAMMRAHGKTQSFIPAFSGGGAGGRPPGRPLHRRPLRHQGHPHAADGP
ncbi:MAG TPA: hypothetical protein VG499_05430, partial [Actinomycetota bacterium]|nr:hypothetical protein [Actinomycetota bacterium]